MNPNDLPEAYRIACEAWAAGLRRPPRVTVNEWADRNRMLTESESSEPGPWRTDRMPFLSEIMEALSPWSPVQRVVFVKSTQVGGTECLINWIGAVIAEYGGPMLVVEPTIEVSELFSKQRLANMIANSRTLSARIRPSRTRDGGNTTLLKEFPGGVVRLAGGNSAASLRSMPVKFLGLDEVDAYPDDLDGEGDPVGLAEERTNNFPRRKVFLISTPTIKGASRIDREWEQSDQRRYHVPCPHCGHMQPLRWANLKWDDEIQRAWYVCEDNGCVIEEHEKPKMLAAGEWIAAFPDRITRGYHINSLYSPLGLGRSWIERVRQWQAAQGDAAQLKRFVNTCLGETWEDRSNKVTSHALMARCEPYRLRTIPVGCLLLTAGVDTQDDRLEVTLIGWGRNETIWVIDTHVIWGSPALDETWDKLDNWLQQPIMNAFGVSMRISAVAVDTGGHHTHDVYNFCRWRAHRRVFAIKGVSTPNKAILGKPTAQDVDWRGQMQKNGVMLWPIGTDTAKSALFARLDADSETEITRRKVHFPQGLPDDYFQQLTAEAFDPEKNRWVKRKGRRNEALDTMVYAMAAGHHPDLNVHKSREADWQMLESMLEPVTRDLFSADPPRAEPASGEVAAQATAAPVQNPNPAPAGFFVAQDEWLGQQDNEDWLI